MVKDNSKGMLPNKNTLFTTFITIALSLFAGWMGMSARVYNIEKNLEIVRLDVSNVKAEVANTKSIYEKMDQRMNQTVELFNRIDKSIVELRGDLALKADKQFK